MTVRNAYRGAGTFDITKVPRMLSNVQPAPKEPAVYTVSGLTGTPEQKQRRIDELIEALGHHVTIIEVPEGVTLNRLA